MPVGSLRSNNPLRPNSRTIEILDVRLSYPTSCDEVSQDFHKGSWGRCALLDCRDHGRRCVRVCVTTSMGSLYGKVYFTGMFSPLKRRLLFPDRTLDGILDPSYRRRRRDRRGYDRDSDTYSVEHSNAREKKGGGCVHLPCPYLVSSDH